MSEYVYALHDFLPEHEDEVSFHAGERIEVVEKDDQYGDGWWQGRNLAGKVGLFPQSYTTPAQPSLPPSLSVTEPSPPYNTVSSPLQTLEEEQSNKESPSVKTHKSAKSNGSRASQRSASDGEIMMKETMTDVQKAIEQLGGGRDGDEAKSFSFRSTKDTDTETEMTDGEGGKGEDWHKGARSRLADAVASRAMQEEVGEHGKRSIQPPIDVEMSDESEDDMDDDDRPLHPYARAHPRISEEDEGDDERSPKADTVMDISLEKTIEVQMGEDDEETIRTAMPKDYPSPQLPFPSTQPPSETQIPTPAASLPTPISPGLQSASFKAADEKTPGSTYSIRPLPAMPTAIVTPATHNLPSPQASKHSSAASAVNGGGPAAVNGKKSTLPSEWTVEEVVDWLHGKGFESDVCDKFREQEITGDVLLELDVNLLKSEIGIPAFGKRMRIANAIADLRRPPSIIHSDTAGKGGLHSHSQSMQSVGTSHSWNGIVNTGSSPLTTTAPYSPIGESASSVGSEDGAVGLGIGMPSGKLRPPNLSLSPSDSNLHSQAKGISNIPEEADDERSAMSESEAPSQNVRRRFFGRSESSASKEKEKARSARGSREISSPLSIPPSPSKTSSPEQETSPSLVGSRRKRTVDGHKGGKERLSLFGASFGGTLNKSRKPPPRYSAADQDQERSSLSIWRQTRKISTKSGEGSPRSPPVQKGESESPKDVKDPTLLRKRTNSTDGQENGTGRLFRAGQSILEQIGNPDHTGWMRKRGDRYNSWKLRYFVLKGSDMYCLKSSSGTETKIKGYINILGYKVVADENLDPGRYGFKIIHDTDKTHFFSSDEQQVIREWMKAIMKSTIARDYTRHVVSSANVPTIPLVVAQTMNPSPRPPSPGARDATQKALLRDNPNQLSSRDARILMGLPSEGGPQLKESERARFNSFFSGESMTAVDSNALASGLTTPVTLKSPAPPRPGRESRRFSTMPGSAGPSVDAALIEWANSHLPKALQIKDHRIPDVPGLMLLRLAESIKGRPLSPPVSDSAFPSGPNDDKLDGLFLLFDFLLDNDVKMGSVSINDIRQGRRDKIVQLLRALKVWDDKNMAIAQNFTKSPTAVLTPVDYFK